MADKNNVAAGFKEAVEKGFALIDTTSDSGGYYAMRLKTATESSAVVTIEDRDHTYEQVWLVKFELTEL